MTRKDSLWSRMGHWMDSFRRDATLPELAMRSRVTPISAVDPGPANVESAEDKGSNRLMPWRKRDQILQQLQSGYDRILGLVESKRSVSFCVTADDACTCAAIVCIP